MRENPIRAAAADAPAQIRYVVTPACLRRVRIAASEPKKQHDTSAWPLGKLYDCGSWYPKKASAGRDRPKTTLRIWLSDSPPSDATASIMAACRRLAARSRQMIRAPRGTRTSSDPQRV